jgi:hypothetical protein
MFSTRGLLALFFLFVSEEITPEYKRLPLNWREKK